MQIKPDEITSILKQRIEGLEDGGANLSEVGTVLSVAVGISRVHGLIVPASGESLKSRARRAVPGWRGAVLDERASRHALSTASE